MPDLRGHGWSEAPKEGYEKERIAADLVGLMDALGLNRVGFIGHDWGGYVGMLIAMERPDRLSALLALSIAHPWPSWRDRLNPWRLAALSYQLPLSTPFLGERLMRAGATRQVLRRAAPSGTYAEKDLAAFDEPMRSRDGARATVALYRAFLLRELPSIAAGRFQAARLRVPARLVVGEKDPIIRGADLGGFEDHATLMTVERVPGVGHFLPEESPGLVVKHAEDLFEGTRGASA
jgi:pimeloyl-ACP methyl ester carboxylesterase